MKTLISALFVTILLIIFGCGNSSNLGSKYDFMEPNTSLSNNTGYLKVLTDTYKEKGEYGEDPADEVYKGYSIYTRNGDFIKDVENSYRAPRLVRLDEGEYVVIAELQKNIVQSFVVSIEKGKLMEVDKSMAKNPLAME